MKIKGIIWFVAWIILFCACSKEKTYEDTPKEETININSSVNMNPVFTSSGGSSDIYFTASSNWSASVINTRADSWISLQPTSGLAGENTLSITLTPNESYDERNATIQIKCGKDIKNIKVTQKQKNALTLTSSRIEVSQKGEVIQAEVKSNIQYEVEIPEQYKDWITLIPQTRTLSSSLVKFKIAPSLELDQREGKIIICEKGEMLSDTLHIYQFGGPIVVISQKEYTIPCEGKIIDVNIESNTDYDVLPIKVDWITEVMERNTSTHTLRYLIAPNSGSEPRSAQIIFNTRNSKMSDTISIYQVPQGVLAITPSQCNVGDKGGKINVEVCSNEKYSIKIPTSVKWIHQTPTRAITTNIINFTVDENISNKPREATILITSETLTGTLTVKQASHIEISFSTDTLYVPSDAVSKEIILSANTNWRLQSNNENWCTVTPKQGGEGKYTIRVDITENTSMLEPRKAVLSAKADTLSREVIVIQERKKPDPNITKGIHTLDDLINFRDAVNQKKDISMWKYNGEINLLADIDLSYVENWEPIGYWDSNYKNVPFTGIFNGNGYTIKNLTINSNASTIGLFGYNCGIIKNIYLKNVNITGTNTTSTNNYIGGICAWNFLGEGSSNGKISNCLVEGKIRGDYDYAGGICGKNQNLITSCTNKAIIVAQYAGGICGLNQSTVNSCTNMGLIAGENNGEGGEINGNHSKATDCISTGKTFNKKFYLVLTTNKGEINDSSIEKITNIFCSSQKLSSLKGLEYFTNLTKLECNYNSLSELDLSNNNKLTSLLCDNNNLKVLTIERCNNIQKVSCNNNALKNINLSNTTQIKELYCNNNKLTSLDINNCVLLTTLQCDNNQLQYLNINTLKHLTSLSCRDNKISKLETTHLPYLKQLYCSNNLIDNIDLTQNKFLEHFECNNNKLKDVNLPTTLISLRCSSNQLTSINVKECTNLNSLSCAKNKISTIDVSNNEKLHDLYCEDNCLSYINLGKAPINSLYLSYSRTEPNTYLTGSLTIISSNLKDLNCAKHKLTSLDISSCPNLSKVNCANNKLTKLDISDCPNLSKVDCANNELTNLDISKCITHMSEVYCEDNDYKYFTLWMKKGQTVDGKKSPTHGYRKIITSSGKVRYYKFVIPTEGKVNWYD